MSLAAFLNVGCGLASHTLRVRSSSKVTRTRTERQQARELFSMAHNWVLVAGDNTAHFTRALLGGGATAAAQGSIVSEIFSNARHRTDRRTRTRAWLTHHMSALRMHHGAHRCHAMPRFPHTGCAGEAAGDFDADAHLQA